MLNNIVFDGQHITPSKVVCVGRNYVEHIEELGNEIPEHMVVFTKPNSSITDQLISTHQSEKLHYEAELCFLYQQGRLSAVALGLDLTKRTLQSYLKNKGLPWERAKAFDGSALFSEFITIKKNESKAIDNTLTLSLEINNTLIQQGSVQLMMYKPEQILAEIQSFMTLEDGDIIMTGTPKGVGIINKGDVFLGKLFVDNIEILSKQWQALQ